MFLLTRTSLIRKLQLRAIDMLGLLLRAVIFALNRRNEQ